MKRIAIVGAGISGLFVANLFKKDPNYQITIYEKNDSIELEKGYGIQLSVNSVELLNKIGFSELNEKERFNPKKIDFYSINNPKKICELDITDFNSDDCKYTTLKRSILINFLKKDLKDLIKTGYNISKINEQKKTTKLYFENSKSVECDYLIISDGVFSKSKNLISNNQINVKYNNTIAIRGTISERSLGKINEKNISLFLGSNFHYVIYPTSSIGDFNYIGILNYHLKSKELLNYTLFDDYSFISKIFNKIPESKYLPINKLENIKLFPIFISNNFYKPMYKNTFFIGDAFYAFSPSLAQGASQSIEGAYELFKSITNNTQGKFFIDRIKKLKMVNNRSKFNQFAFHLSSPLMVFFRNIILKRLVKNKKFLENYLGKIYRN
tara:strand:- start:748 stop:1896 length:1149 start_codon:yes stop_codon:yes gene_type:complete